MESKEGTRKSDQCNDLIGTASLNISVRANAVLMNVLN